MAIHAQPTVPAKLDVAVRPLREDDLPAADHIMRLAFGTFLGLPEPASFMGDAAYVRARWRADPDAAFGAEVGGELVGSNFATNWGTVGFFGPLTIRPDLWDRGVGKRLRGGPQRLPPAHGRNLRGARCEPRDQRGDHAEAR